MYYVLTFADYDNTPVWHAARSAYKWMKVNKQMHFWYKTIFFACKLQIKFYKINVSYKRAPRQ